MADDPTATTTTATTAAGKPHGMSKFLSRERWRSKISADETQMTARDATAGAKASGYGMNDDLADFLNPSAGRPGPMSPPKAPRIDIAAAQRWAGNSAELRSGNGMSTPSSMRGRGDNQRRPRRKNLNVSFSMSIDIIGEGGDECEMPCIEISRRRHLTAKRESSKAMLTTGAQSGSRPLREPPPPPRNLATDGEDEDLHPGFSRKGKDDYSDIAAAYRQLVGDDSEDQPPSVRRMAGNDLDGDDFAPKPLRRAGTGFHPNTGRESLSSTYSEEGTAGPRPATVTKPTTTTNMFQLPEFSSILDDSPLELSLDPFSQPRNRDSSLSSPVIQDKIHKMRAEEGRALHENAYRPVTDLAVEEPTPQSSSSTSSSYRAYSPVDVMQKPPSSSSSAYAGTSNQRAPPSLISQSAYTPASAILRQNTAPSYPPQSSPEKRSQITLPNRKPIAPAAGGGVSFRSTPTPPLNSQLSTRPASRGASSPLPSLSIPSSKSSFVSQSTSSDPRVALTQPPPPPPPPPPPSRVPDHRTTPSTATSYQSPASAFTQASYEDFAERCSHMKGVFELQAQYDKPISQHTPTQWLRCAAWWFVRGRAGMEAIIRSRPRSQDGQNQGSAKSQDLLLTQPHVDLAKSWWILGEIMPFHPDLPSSPDASFAARCANAAAANDMFVADFFESADILLYNLKALISSMARNKALPPSHALIQGQDQTIWVKTPSFAPDLLPILSGSKSRSLTASAAIRVFDPLTIMAVADTKSDFSYYRWFVMATLGTDEDMSERVPLPCLFSVMRTRNDWHPKIAICTQKETVTVCVTGDRKAGPSWEDVKWSESDWSLQVRLPHGYALNVQLAEPDYRVLASMYNMAFAAQSSLFPLKNEHVAFDLSLREVRYSDTMRPPAFPLERLRRCRVRIFAKTEIRTEGTGQRRFYRGLRLLVVTSPKNKQLASASHDIGMARPIIVEMGMDKVDGENAPAMAIHFKEEKRKASLFMVFGDTQERQMLYSTLNQMDLTPEETKFASVRLKGLSIEPTPEEATQNPLGRMQWQDLTVLNKDPENPDHDVGQTVLSDNLRIISQGPGGVVTDRINLGPGELKLRLTADGTPTLMILRQAQDDLSMTFDCRSAPFTPDQVEDLAAAAYNQATKRVYSFFNLSDMHAFQTAITGFTVKYDSLAPNFTISRRRPVTALSKHKKFEAGLTRIQVVAHDHDKIVQMLVFFDEDFPYADAMGFVLKGVDVFERFESKHSGMKGKFGVRIVDAKFTLPRTEKGKGGPSSLEDVERAFVCLDMPEYPGENDDIWIGFDDVDEREKFLAALPAPATHMSRGLTLMKRP